MSSKQLYVKKNGTKGHIGMPRRIERQAGKLYIRLVESAAIDEWWWENASDEEVDEFHKQLKHKAWSIVSSNRPNHNLHLRRYERMMARRKASVKSANVIPF